MKQDMIVILDLGSTENTAVARQIRDMGVYSEIHPHDITPQALKELENVKGIVLNGGENRVVDGAAVDIDPALYDCGYPMIAIDHPTARCEKRLETLPDKETLREFVFDTCHAQANWNMKNFIEDQVELIRRQVGDRKVLLALSGGVVRSCRHAHQGHRKAAGMRPCEPRSHAETRIGERHRSIQESASCQSDLCGCHREISGQAGRSG